MLWTNCSSDRNPIKSLEMERFKGYRTLWVEEEVADESEDVEHRNRMFRSNENAQSLAHLHTFHLIGQWKVNHIKSHGPGDYQNLHIPRKIFFFPRPSHRRLPKSENVDRWQESRPFWGKCFNGQTNQSTLSRVVNECWRFLSKISKNFSKKFQKKIHLKFIQLKKLFPLGGDVSQVFCGESDQSRSEDAAL